MLTENAVLFGWIGDRIKRRHLIFLSGLTTLLCATAILALGRHIGVLILGRVLQGTSAAIVWTSGLALLTDIFGKERYGEAVGYANTAVSVGTTSAPLLGGLVYTRGGYGAVSFMSAGTIAVALILALIMVEPRPIYSDYCNGHGTGEHTNGNGYPNGHTNGNHFSNGNQEQNGTKKDLSSGDSHDSESDDANETTSLIPRKDQAKKRQTGATYGLLLSNGRIVAGMTGIFTFSFVMISIEAMIPMFVKDMFHWNSAIAALTYLAWIIPGFLGPLAGKMSDRYGSRWIAIGGLLCAVPPLILMRLVDHDSTSQKVLLCSLLTLVGESLKLSFCRQDTEADEHAFTQPGLSFVWIQPACFADLSTAASDLKREHPSDFDDGSGASSQAFGLFVFAYSCGCLIGPTVAGILKAKVSWGAATLILACACIAACIPIVRPTFTSPFFPSSPSLAQPQDGQQP